MIDDTIIRQHAFLVADIEAAMRFWIAELGVGPFFHLPLVHSTASLYRGNPTEMRISLAIAQRGSVQIELVQQLNDGPSLFREFIQAGRTGFHHVAYWTEDFDATVARYVSRRLTIVQSANPGGGANRNCFFESGNPLVSYVEVSEVAGEKGRLFAEVAEAGANWDGRDPIRLLSGMRPTKAT
jgi:catechol 2,3-dioxygenase-like lactoylglutathione lyase family enzyme